MSDWNNEYSYYISEEESCVEIGSAIAGEAESIDTTKAFKISKSTLLRLMSYYVEAGLMNSAGAEKPFTELAERVARRHSIVGGNLFAFKVISGKIKLASPTAPRADLDDEIPF
jgi:hypothetical protein